MLATKSGNPRHSHEARVNVKYITQDLTAYIYTYSRRVPLHIVFFAFSHAPTNARAHAGLRKMDMARSLIDEGYSVSRYRGTHSDRAFRIRPPAVATLDKDNHLLPPKKIEGRSRKRKKTGSGDGAGSSPPGTDTPSSSMSSGGGAGAGAEAGAGAGAGSMAAGAEGRGGGEVAI